MEGSEESRKNETLSLCRALSIVSAVGRAGGGAPVLDIHYRKFHDFKFGNHDFMFGNHDYKFHK